MGMPEGSAAVVLNGTAGSRAAETRSSKLFVPAPAIGASMQEAARAKAKAAKVRQAIADAAQRKDAPVRARVTKPKIVAGGEKVLGAGKEKVAAKAKGKGMEKAKAPGDARSLLAESSSSSSSSTSSSATSSSSSSQEGGAGAGRQCRCSVDAVHAIVPKDKPVLVTSRPPADGGSTGSDHGHIDASTKASAKGSATAAAGRRSGFNKMKAKKTKGEKSGT